MGYEFKINEEVLIPRFETELLVKKTIEYINCYFKNPKIIDLGCGSGVIGITLKKEIPAATITCLDINNKALSLTKTNAQNLTADITIIKGDMLTKTNEKYDVIISNPPYINIDEEIDLLVFNNEPHQALFAPNKGLYYYEEILSKATANLNSRALIAFEIGMTQAKEIIEIGKKYFPHAKYNVHQDLNNRDRYIFILINL